MFSFKEITKEQRLGLIYLFIGLVLISLYSSWKFYSKRVLSFDENISQEEQVNSLPKPVRIMIDKISLDLPVEETAIDGGIWQVSEEGVGHLNTSANPGEGGNIVIYGHNKNNLFGPIRWLEKGDLVKVINEEGDAFLYKIVETTQVKPTDLEYVLPKEKEVLTLYTCDGFLDSKRYIVLAEPIY